MTPASHVLPSGVQVVAAARPGTGVVALQFWVLAGSAQEEGPGATGVAHLLEHLMFGPTPTLDAAAREDLLLRNGVRENAWTWLDQTVYHMVLPADALPVLLAEEADRFAHVRVEPEDVRREAGAVQGEWRNARSDPDEALSNALHAAAFAGTSRAWPTLGLDQDVARLPEAWEATTRFRARWYRPEHLLVVAVGDLEPEAFFQEVERAWGGWAPEPWPPSAPAGDPERDPVAAADAPGRAPPSPRRIDVPWADAAAAPRTVLAWPVPGFDPSDPASASAELATVLLCGDASPIRRRLVDQEGVLEDLACDLPPHVGPRLLAVTARPAAGVDAEAARAALDEAIAALPALDDEAILRARDHVAARTRIRMADPAVAAEWLGLCTQAGGPEGLPTWLATLERLQASAFRGFARTRLAPELAWEARLLPGAEAGR